MNHWHTEMMVKYKMQEIDHAVKQAQLLREAGLSRPSLLARGFQALGNLLKRRSKKTQVRRSLEHESSQAIGDD